MRLSLKPLKRNLRNKYSYGIKVKRPVWNNVGFMKFNYDFDYVVKITKLSKENILELLKYFDGLPLQAKLEAFFISKIIEEDDEFAFHQHYFAKEKIAEYEFALFILGVERIYSIENKDVSGNALSAYKLNLISKIKRLRNQDE